MINKKVLLISVIIALLLFSGGYWYSCKNVKSNKEIAGLKQENSDLNKKISELSSENETLNNKIKELETESASADESTVKSIDGVLPIYTADSDSLKKEAFIWVYVNDKSSLNDKLGVLAKTLSKVYFGNLPIEVSQIKEINGKKIAVINLMESKENQAIKDPSNFKGVSWADGYFQGSTGGDVTTTSLSETILQRDYKGEWIDGVLFQYNNKTIDFEHVPDLNDIIYR